MLAGEDLTILPISDLHIGAEDSVLTPESLLSEKDLSNSTIHNWQRIAAQTALDRLMKEPDIVVINGDVRDNVAPDNEPGSKKDQAITKYSLKLLERWVTADSDKPFYYVLGNHDGNTSYDFKKRLLQLAERHDNLHVTDYGVKIGDILFTHGDLQTRQITPADRADWTIGREHDLALLGKNKVQTTTAMLQRFYEMMEKEELAKDFVILRHGEPASLLTLEELRTTPYVMLGHSHMHMDAIQPQARVGATFGINSGSFLRLPKKRMEDDDELNSPEDLKQQMLHLKQGKLDAASRAFPAVASWTELSYEKRDSSSFPIER